MLNVHALLSALWAWVRIPPLGIQAVLLCSYGAVVTHRTCNAKILGSNPSASTHSFCPSHTHTQTCVRSILLARAFHRRVCVWRKVGGREGEEGKEKGLHAVVDMRGAMDKCESE